MDIAPGIQELTSISMDGIFGCVAPFWRKSRGKQSDLKLNFTGVTFVDPYAAAALCVLVRAIKERGRSSVIIVPPEDSSVVGYLGSLGFWKQIGNYSDIAGDLSLSTDSVLHNSKVLLKLTPIRKKRDIKNVVRHLLGIVSDNLEYSSKSVAKIIDVVDELCMNVLDHSESFGWAAAQRYTHRTGQRFVRIGVADGGIGIKSSLQRRYKKGGDKWTHLDAIINALEKDVSRFPNRGLGLHMIKKIVKDFKGYLHIRSGDSRLFIGKTVNHFHGAWFPGVQVSIDLTERVGA